MILSRIQWKEKESSFALNLRDHIKRISIEFKGKGLFISLTRKNIYIKIDKI